MCIYLNVIYVWELGSKEKENLYTDTYLIYNLYTCSNTKLSYNKK